VATLRDENAFGTKLEFHLRLAFMCAADGTRRGSWRRITDARLFRHRGLMATLSFNGRRVTYGDAGAGRPVVFIHGTFSRSSAWKRVVDSLGGVARRFLTPDLPGWGESDPPPEECIDLARYQAEAVEAVVSHSATEAVDIAAHSYGAVVALAIATAGTIPVRSLVLFEPLPVGVLSQTGDTDAFAEIETFASAYRNAFEGGDESAGRLVIDMWAGSGTFDAMSTAVRASIASGTPQNLREWVANLRFRPPPEVWRALPMPSTIVIGEHAHPLTRLISERLCGLLPASALMEIPGAGHFMIHTHAAEVARVIQRVSERGA
jgi:lipase